MDELNFNNIELNDHEKKVLEEIKLHVNLYLKNSIHILILFFSQTGTMLCF
jgi:hypothetical protein